jgi:sulfate transport system ATP-binding protein
VTTVFVTHDQEEALELADRVVVMNAGRVEQVGRPDEVFDRPASAFVMDFLGSVNVFHGRVEAGRGMLGPLVLDLPGHPDALAGGYVRPHELDLDRDPGDGAFGAVVERLSAAGPLARVDLRDDEGRRLRVEMARERYEALRPAVGERLQVRVRNVRVFAGEALTASR